MIVLSRIKIKLNNKIKFIKEKFCYVAQSK